LNANLYRFYDIRNQDGYCGRPFQEIRGADPFKKREETTRKSHRRRLLGSVYLLAMTNKKNEYFMFFVVDALYDSNLWPAFFVFP
jgi:hypothetical protein